MEIKIFRLFVHRAPRRFIVDARFMPKLRRFSWHYMKKQNRAWAVIRKNKPRVMLHKYVLRLAGKSWIESFFENGNVFDCRIGNLRPYDRSEQGATRTRFKNNKSGFKGVYFRKSNGKNKKSDSWSACIRVKGKLQNLGYFASPEEAARAYRAAYKLAHPNLKA